MELDDRLKKLEQLGLQVQAVGRLGREKITPAGVELISLACLELATQHAVSIVALTRKYHYASASALLRVLLESFAKHFWFLHCANPADAKTWQEDNLELKIGRIIDDLEKKQTSAALKAASTIKISWSHRDRLHGYTHTGRDPVARRLLKEFGSVGGVRDDDESEIFLNFSLAFLVQISCAYIYMYEDTPFRATMAIVIEQFESMSSAKQYGFEEPLKTVDP